MNASLDREIKFKKEPISNDVQHFKHEKTKHEKTSNVILVMFVFISKIILNVYMYDPSNQPILFNLFV